VLPATAQKSLSRIGLFLKSCLRARVPRAGWPALRLRAFGNAVCRPLEGLVLHESAVPLHQRITAVGGPGAARSRIVAFVVLVTRGIFTERRKAGRNSFGDEKLALPLGSMTVFLSLSGRWPYVGKPAMAGE